MNLRPKLAPSRLVRVAAAASMLSLLSAACQKKEAPPPAPAAAAPVPAPAPPKRPPAPPKPAIKALEWEDPKEWKRVKPSSSMRQASYEIPPAKGDKVPGELNVFILGGDIEPNIQRWVGEFSGFDIKTLVRSDRTVNDLTQAVVELPKGKFNGGMATTTVSENFGLLGAIVVTPEGAKYFFKLTGPSGTIKAARKPFYAMLDSMHMEGSKPGAAPAEGATTPAAAGTAAPAPAPSGAVQPAGEAAAAKK
jgi:hypothetical protein